MKEEWKDIKGFDGRYQISNTGYIKSIPYFIRKELDKKTKIKTTTKIKFFNPSIDKNGYYETTLINRKESKSVKIHRLVATHFVENPGNKKNIKHIDDNKLYNYYLNLKWTNENHQKWKSKLIKEQIKEIYFYKGPERDMKEKYNISQSYVNDIRSGKKLKNIIKEILEEVE